MGTIDQRLSFTAHANPCSTPMQKKLSKLAAESADKGRWALAAAATRASVSDTVDDHINVLGAMHEAGLLKNSLAPFAKIWRDDASAFAAACA
jgi:hypothetical protein